MKVSSHILQFVMTHRDGIIFPSVVVQFLKKKRIFISEKSAGKFLRKLESPLLKNKNQMFWSNPNRYFFKPESQSDNR
jgi:hypothetical protein